MIYLGTNGKMSEVSAAMGITGLESVNDFISVNHDNYQVYKKGLKNVPGVTLIDYNMQESNNFQYVITEIDESITGISRDKFVYILQKENILARRYFYPGCHNMEPYRSYFPHAWRLLPETEALVKRVMSLPTGTAVDADQIERICHIIRLVAENGQEINDRLGSELVNLPSFLRSHVH